MRSSTKTAGLMAMATCSGALSAWLVTADDIDCHTLRARRIQIVDGTGAVRIELYTQNAMGFADQPASGTLLIVAEEEGIKSEVHLDSLSCTFTKLPNPDGDIDMARLDAKTLSISGPGGVGVFNYDLLRQSHRDAIMPR